MPSRRYQVQNTPQVGTSRNINNEDDEAKASEPGDQENEIQHNPFRPSNLNEIKTPMQPLSIQNFNSKDSVIINENRAEEDCHT